MKVGILCAGDREVAPFLPMIQECKETEKAMLRFYEGTIENVNIVTLFSGVCKVNAAIAAQIMIDWFECDVIINAGTAGGMISGLSVLDTVICTETAYHDVAEGILTDFHPWLDTIWFKADRDLLAIARQAAAEWHSDHKIVFGRMATGDSFIENEQREEISRKYAPLSLDMETASVAHVCYVNRKPFIAIRTITDTPDHSGAAAFEENCAKAARISADFVRNMLRVGEWRDQDEI